MSTSMSMKKAPNRPLFGNRPICQAGMVRGWHWDGAEMAQGWRGDDSGSFWARSPCRRPVMTPERNRFEIGWGMVRHAGMPLKYLWAGSPCRRADR